MIKRKLGDREYWYEAVPSRDGSWSIQTANYSKAKGHWTRPAIDFLTEEEAKEAAESGSPFRYLGQASRRRSLEEMSL